LTTTQWLVAAVSAFLIGFSKTGLPGLGILAVPLMAWSFGGRLSVGATLPMLIIADCFAVAFYKAHADWVAIKKLSPWVVLGIVLGTVTLILLAQFKPTRDVLSPTIGVIVLLMLLLGSLKGRLGEKMVPHSPAGTALTGALAGFTTMTSNAAGPVMGIYMATAGFSKHALLGTSAWTFFIFNIVKLPPLILVNALYPQMPLLTWETLALNVMVAPILVAGALAGRPLALRIPEKFFMTLVQALAATAAMRLVFVS
jgi:hypothetical protein